MSRPRSPKRPPTHIPGPGLGSAVLTSALGSAPSTCPYPGTDSPLLDPGTSAALTERARQVAEATRLPVAFLDGTGAPLRIDATTEPVEGGHNHTSTTAHYPDGVTLSVRANLPGQVPAEDPANVRTAASGAGLFTGGTLVADGV
ncbi:hypothetical protein ACWC5I_47580, partial [Kitasatospora sp. NPDC001574]